MNGEPRRILVRVPNWIGDVVLSLGALRDVRRNFPGARIEVLARPRVADLYGAVGEIDAVRRSQGVRGDAAAIKAGFDAAILFTNSFGTALTTFLARIPERWGYASDGRGFLLTRRPRVPEAVRGRSQVYYYRAMLAGVGLQVSAAPDVALHAPEAWSGRAAELLGGGDWLGVSPGASFGSAKQWLPERYAAVADRLAKELAAGVAILGSAAERPLGDAIASKMTTKPRVLCGETSLSELVGVLARLRLVVTNDSGSMHLASALGVPLVAIFGSTDWRETAPAGPAPSRLVREDVDCAPCMLRECPIDHRCMTRVSAERVASEALKLLA